MPRINANGVELAYDFHGSESGPVMLMIQGLGMPSTGWPPEFLELFIDEGFRVLTFDNRDVGLSEKFDHLPVPSIPIQFARNFFGFDVQAPYPLKAMMLDADSLLSALNIEAAHVVGISMGGMIAQLLAIHAPERVKSLTSIMSTTGKRGLPGPTAQVTRKLMSRPDSSSRDDVLAHHKKLWALIGSPGYERSDDEMTEFLTRIFDRGITAQGTNRQMLAIMATPSRVEALSRLALPSLVIHGDQDPLVPLACGEDTANAIPGANLHVMPGMGHDLPSELYARFRELIAGHARRAESSEHRAA